MLLITPSIDATRRALFVEQQQFEADSFFDGTDAFSVKDQIVFFQILDELFDGFDFTSEDFDFATAFKVGMEKYGERFFAFVNSPFFAAFIEFLTGQEFDPNGFIVEFMEELPDDFGKGEFHCIFEFDDDSLSKAHFERQDRRFKAQFFGPKFGFHPKMQNKGKCFVGIRFPKFMK